MKGLILRSQKAFSLVEVAISLGIISFVLLAIAGLMSVGLDASKSAQTDTILAASSRAILARAATNDFGTFSSNVTWINLDGTTNTSSNNSFYKAVLTVVSNPSGLRSEVSTEFQLLKLQFMYPAMAPAANQTTNTIYASRAR